MHKRKSQHQSINKNQQQQLPQIIQRLHQLLLNNQTKIK